MLAKTYETPPVRVGRGAVKVRGEASLRDAVVRLALRLLFLLVAFCVGFTAAVLVLTLG